jgi:hypothetical protein
MRDPTRNCLGLFTTGNLITCVPMFQRKARSLSGVLERIIETEDGIVERK